ncbi:DUF5818 domain-containing protein [Sphingomicrobium sp. XHP0235]|uniref:DUF5818 domain-containing protein n=1 Tax=Sphingomicrobium aquimarinum TaxID=3133971 RepID=UPI0031FEAAD7
MKKIVALVPFALIAACAAPDTPPPAASDGASGTRPAGEPQLYSFEGTLSRGTECAVLAGDNGRRWSVSSSGIDAQMYGKRVRIVGEIADASFCMEGEGTIIATQVTALR